MMAPANHFDPDVWVFCLFFGYWLLHDLHGRCSTKGVKRGRLIHTHMAILEKELGVLAEARHWSLHYGLIEMGLCTNLLK